MEELSEMAFPFVVVEGAGTWAAAANLEATGEGADVEEKMGTAFRVGEAEAVVEATVGGAEE